MFNIGDNKRRALNALSGNWMIMVLNTLIFSVISMSLSGIIQFGSNSSDGEISIMLPFIMMTSFIASFLPILIVAPMKRGYSELALRTVRGISLNSDTVFIGFSDFVRSLLANLIISIILSIPIIACSIIIFIVLIISVIAGLLTPYISSSALAGSLLASYLSVFLLIFAVFLAGTIVSLILGYRYRFVYYIMIDNPNMSFFECIKESAKQTKGIKFDLFLTDLSFIGWGILAVLTFFIGFLWLTPYKETTVASIYNELNSISSRNKFNSEIVNNFENNREFNNFCNSNDVNVNSKSDSNSHRVDTDKYNNDDYPESRDFFDTH